VGWRDEQREQAERTLDALDGIRTDIRALRTVDRSDPHDVRGLVELFKRVPDEHIDLSTGTVRCLCGAVTAFGDLHPCPGGCGRWFAADESGAFAARVQIVAEAA
jgi:hypothetical protein